MLWATPPDPYLFLPRAGEIRARARHKAGRALLGGPAGIGPATAESTEPAWEARPAPWAWPRDLGFTG